MKLKTKIIGSSILAMLLFSLSFSMLILWQSRQDTINRVVELQKNIFESGVKHVKQSLSGVTYEGDKDAVRKDIVLYYTKNNLPGTHAIYKNGQEIYNSTGLEFTFRSEPDEYNLDTGKSQIYENGAQKVLVLYKGFHIWKNQYIIYRTVDISELYESSSVLFYRGIGLAVLFCMVTGVILYILIQKILKPFYQLKTAAIEIEAGNYEKRAAVGQKDEVGEVADRFNRMAEKIQEKIEFLTEMNERQNLMTGSIAHELKTPMTAMIGYSDALLRLDLSKEQQEKALIYIGKECRRLTDLSAKIMELVGLNNEGAVIEKKKLPVMKLVENMIEATKTIREEKQIQLIIVNEEEKNGDIVIEGDEIFLTSLLINLTDNAIKATANHGDITIRLSKESLTVIDQGIGIPEDELQRIMDPFYMVDKSRSRRQGGTGLGLSLCRQIAMRHNMELKIESRQGEGTSAALIFPAGITHIGCF